MKHAWYAPPIMLKRAAVRILMFSPFYFRFSVKERLDIVKSYMRNYNEKENT